MCYSFVAPNVKPSSIISFLYETKKRLAIYLNETFDCFARIVSDLFFKSFLRAECVRENKPWINWTSCQYLILYASKMRYYINFSLSPSLSGFHSVSVSVCVCLCFTSCFHKVSPNWWNVVSKFVARQWSFPSLWPGSFSFCMRYYSELIIRVYGIVLLSRLVIRDKNTTAAAAFLHFLYVGFVCRCILHKAFLWSLTDQPLLPAPPSPRSLVRNLVHSWRKVIWISFEYVWSKVVSSLKYKH